MKEIEILVKLDNSIEDAKSKLSKLNFKCTKHTLDTYFYDPLRKNLKPGKDLSLKECFRLRSQNGKNYIAYKIDNFDNKGVWTYSDEHETEITDLSCALKIINNLGLEPLVKIDNTKYIYLNDKYEVSLEDVKELGIFLEVELITFDEHEEINNLKNQIRKYIKSLGFDFEEMNTGKPELMLKTKKL